MSGQTTTQKRISSAIRQAARFNEMTYNKAFPKESAGEVFFVKLLELERGLLERMEEGPPQLTVRTLCTQFGRSFRSLCVEARKRGKQPGK